MSELTLTDEQTPFAGLIFKAAGSVDPMAQMMTGNYMECLDVSQDDLDAALASFDFIAANADREKDAAIYSAKKDYHDSLKDGFTTNGVLMDAKLSNISILKFGHDLAIINSEETMDIIDFNDDIHQDIPIATALNMIGELGTNARAAYITYQEARVLLNS